MLNCCIRHKLDHQQKLRTPKLKSDVAVSHSHSNPSSPDVDFHTPISSLREPTEQFDKDSRSSSEDEFYEALEDVPQQMESEQETSGIEISEADNVQKLSETEYHTSGVKNTAGVAVDSNGVREGVLKQCGDLILIATGQPLCIPVTQVSEVGQFHCDIIIAQCYFCKIS